MTAAVLAISLFSTASSAATETGFGFTLRGAAVDANCFAPSAPSYYSNSWQLLKDANVNWIRVSGGTEGDVNHFNIQNYPNEWAQNLDNFLAQADSHGIKVSFGGLGSAYGTLFGIRSPGTSGSSADYTPIDQAEAIIDKLAGDNSLHHNFIADPRVLGWVTSNEVYIGSHTNSNPNRDGPLILQWNLQLLDYIHTKGGKAWMSSPTTIEGSSAGYDFARTIPLIGAHVDYLEAHYYEETTLLSSYVKSDGSYDWVGFENYYRNLLTTKMVNARGNFSIDNILLGEFGMWVGDGYDFGLSATFAAQDRANYYNAVLNAAKDAGLKNLCQFDFFEQKGTNMNDYSIVCFNTKTFYPNEAADFLLQAYGSCSISVRLDASTITVGSSARISGKIFPTSSGVPVLVSMRNTGGAWSNLTSVTTDSEGAFSYAWSDMGVGSYEFKASFMENGQTLVESSIASLIVKAITSSIFVNVNSTTVTIGDDLRVSGGISPIRVAAAVTLSSNSQGAGWTTLAFVTTNSSGQFSYLLSGISSGSFQIRASWQGDNITSGAQSTPVYVTVNLLSSSVSIQVSSSTVLEGSTVQLNGQVFPSRTGVNVSVWGRVSGGEASWTGLGVTQTGSSSHFSYSWSVFSVGSYEVKASWPGDATTAGAESNVLVLFINTNQPTSTPTASQTNTPDTSPVPSSTPTIMPSQSPDSSATPTLSPTPTPTAIPTTSPSTSLSLQGESGDNGWFLSEVMVSLTVESETPETCTINYSFDNASWSNYAVPFNVTQSGISTLYFKASDENGNVESPKMATIKIDKEPPHAMAVGDEAENTGIKVAFSGVGSWDDVAVVDYNWDFGDCSSATGQNCTHAYTEAGTYVVTLTVKDASGRNGTDSLEVQISRATDGVPNGFSWLITTVLIAIIAAAGLVTAGIVAKRKKWDLKSKIFSRFQR